MRTDWLAAAVLALAPPHAAADVWLSEGTNISVDVAPDGQLATDLLGGLWIVPPGGGEAVPVASGERSARAPRWSPDGKRLVFEASRDDRPALGLCTLASGETRALGSETWPDREPDWHPDGSRIVFSSARDDTGFDIWELDVETGLSWRLTELPGDEREPAWSANGEHLLYVREHAGTWSLVLKRRGRETETLATSDRPIRAPSWRPDGSLVTWLANDYGGWQVNMTILSEPRLTRPLMRDEDFFLAPVAWADRQRMLYTADGHIRTRPFDAWAAVTVPFRANVGSASGVVATERAVRELPDVPAPGGRRILRAAQFYDGVGVTYTDGHDIVIEGGTIASVEPRRDRDDGILIDLGDATVVPGYIDGYAGLPADADPAIGPLLLTLGVTTLVSDTPAAAALDALWAGKDVPGPRVLPARALAEAGAPADAKPPLPWLVTVSGDMRAASAARPLVREWQSQGVAVLADSWQAGLGSGATLLLGTNTRPTSPGGFHYQDVQLASGVGTVTFVSGLAGAGTPGLDEILAARAAALLAPGLAAGRRFRDPPDLRAAAPLLVLGSRPNGLPPGIALHAEFRALAATGLRADQVLRSAGVNAAAALGAGYRLGRIATGAAADLVVLGGDPLADIADTLKVVAVVRNGRFFSVSGLLDKASEAKSVE